MIPSDIFLVSEGGKHGKTYEPKTDIPANHDVLIEHKHSKRLSRSWPATPGTWRKKPLPSMLRWPPFLALLHVAFARQCLRAGHGCELRGVDAWWLLFFPILMS